MVFGRNYFKTNRTQLKIKIKYQYLILIVVIFTMSSCVKYPQLLYFRNQDEFVRLQDHNITNEVEVKVKPDDAIYVMVRALDQLTAEPFNLFPTQNTTNLGNSSSNTTLQGYLVDVNGNIDMPILGRVNVADKTIDQVKMILLEKLKPYLKEPVVIVRFLNFRFTVLGEVKSPRTISVPGERITILEALGQAGDLTPYSDRDHIMVIREEDGKRTFGYINIHSPDVFQSPYFYLQQNDIVYVEPIKAATAVVRDPLNKALPFISTAVSVLAFFIAITR